MSLLRELESTKTGIEIPIIQSRPYVLSTSVETIDFEPNGFGIRSEFRLQANIGVNFVCNDAEYDEALKIARKQLQHILYSDMIRHIDSALIANMGGDSASVSRELNAAMKLCTGGS